MGKFLGLCFFVAGLAAVYMWGVRPLIAGTPSTPAPITVTARGAPTPIIFTSDERDVATAAQVFLQDWQAKDYAAMYDLLTAQAQKRIARAAFVSRYQGVMAAATVKQVQAAVRSVKLDAPEATVAFSTTMATEQLG